jgi:release factor glutamine methyltransferase
LTLGEVLAATTGYLSRKGIESPRLDAELILARAFGMSRLELYTSFDRPLNESELAVARPLVERRGRREPLAYVLGDWDFRRLTLRTDARALVPRPETEVVAERALAAIAGLAEPRVVDVGTGTGAIALAIADERPEARVTATDVSADALALARENAGRLELAVEFVEADLLQGIEGSFDLVVSNPPYVDAAEIDSLQPEVRDWEPRLALVAGGQTERLAREACDLLEPGGWIVLECHAEHAADVQALLARLGYADATISTDLAGRERVVEARWMPKA